MGYLTLGTWTIPYAWMAFLIAYLYVDLRYRKAESQWPNAFEHLLWVYLISWKASYILFYFIGTRFYRHRCRFCILTAVGKGI